MKLILIIILLIPLSTHSQEPNEIYSKMVNSVYLGLYEDGMRYATRILSEDQFQSVKDSTLLFLGTYFYNRSLYSNKDSLYSPRAYHFLNRLIKETDNENHKRIAEEKLKFLEDRRNNRRLFLQQMNENAEVQSAVAVNLENLYDIFYLYNPSYSFIDWRKTKAYDVAMSICDRIINEYQQFEIYGYYYKILLLLSQFRDDIIYSRNEDKKIRTDYLDWEYNTGVDGEEKNKILSLLDYLNQNYPNESLTLELNLLIGQIYLEVIEDVSTNRRQTKEYIEGIKHLNFIIENEIDKNSFRYVIVKAILKEEN